MIQFENIERRRNTILKFLNSNSITTLAEAKKICMDNHLDVFRIVKEIQLISFEDAGWAYTVGAAAAIKRNL